MNWYKFFGFGILASIFIGLFIAIVALDGIRAALLVYGLTIAITLVIGLASYLITKGMEY